MAPAIPTDALVGPHPSYIEVAKPYMLQSAIDKCLSDLQMKESREDAMRLQGVTWIDNVRRSLQLPVRTFNTAVVYYHKFRLLHGEAEYNWADASAAALFTACKIEDTLKKSREILCANWNLKIAPGEHLSPDDARFENHSKLIIGLERLMLESAGFDFRNRYPQKLVVKLGREVGFRKEAEGATAWNAGLDLYRTWAPLKQSTTTMAVACVELAARLHDMDVVEQLVDRGRVGYGKLNTSRGQVMETLLDLLDLYTHHRPSTTVGPLYPLETFINIRITLNQEASAAHIPRYALYASDKPRNGVEPPSPLTPATPGTISPGTAAPTSAIGIRGQNGTVRFMLDAARARGEKVAVDRYHKAEEEEYEVEVPVTVEVEAGGGAGGGDRRRVR
ncbi:cyclin-like protein [Lophiostoma macrostomum CBS 122681]|uniref:RNA polymerase II holoenzyme cyclin-like subunit n=1 Tax=Lophiostoma macrostomum CBS 122681 TaxID=1314788 RepID=A0A6A6THS9_9PLEO|nr:cyclin-like protein [Lophiostoma macrostomum CBS 122681]